MKNAAALFDVSAIALSGLCLLPCLALPLLAALLPLFGTWSEAEGVHGVFVLIAVPALAVLWFDRRRRDPAFRARLDAWLLERPLAGPLLAAGYAVWCLALLWLQPRSLLAIASFLLPCYLFICSWLWRRGWRPVAVGGARSRSGECWQQSTSAMRVTRPPTP